MKDNKLIVKHRLSKKLLRLKPQYLISKVLVIV